MNSIGEKEDRHIKALFNQLAKTPAGGVVLMTFKTPVKYRRAIQEKFRETVFPAMECPHCDGKLYAYEYNTKKKAGKHE
jgi:hypothetical protein